MAIPDLLELAADPTVTPYVDDATGQVVFKNATNDAATLRDRAASGLRQATAADLEQRTRYLRNTETAAQAKAAGKLAANVATFGAAGFDSAQDREQIAAFRDASPTLSTLTETVGALAPAALASTGVGAALGAVGAGARAAAIGGLVAEEITAATAIERQQAQEEGRDIDAVNVIAGLPLAMGMSAAARIARSGKSWTQYAAERAARYGDDTTPAQVLELAAAPNAISTGAKTNKARRSVGAAGAADETRVPLTENEVRLRVENAEQYRAEAEKFGGDAVEETVGGLSPTFDAVHNIGHKKTDYAGKMGDADIERVGQFATAQTKALEDVAASLESEGQKGFARELREHIRRVDEAWNVVASTPEDMANAFDDAKRTLWRYRNKYGAMQDVRAEGFVQQIDDVANGLRTGLESRKTWGKVWAEKQAVENAIWSGPRGIIRTGASWMSGILEQAPGAAGKAWRGADTVPVMQLRNGWLDHVLSLDDRAFKRKLTDMTDWIDGVRQMSQTKVELGVPSVDHSPVMRLNRGLDDLELLRDELVNMREAAKRGSSYKAKLASVDTSRGGLEQLFDLAKEVPGVSKPLRAYEAAHAKLTGRPLFEAPVAPPSAELSRDAAREAVRARARGTRRGYGPSTPPTPAGSGGAIPPPGPRPVSGGGSASVTPPSVTAAHLREERRGERTSERGMASVGALTAPALVGGLYLAASPVTALLHGLSEDSAAVRERAALGLVAPSTRPPPLPPTMARFIEGNRSLAEAFELRKSDLQTALSNPEALLAGLDDAYAELSKAHPELYATLIQRTHAAALYVMAEAPPSVAVSLKRPNGIAPDPLAMARWADIWSGAFSPGDVIYDVGTGQATPTQVKALRDVHPDVYDALRIDILKAVGDAEDVIPFETLRKLDVLFDMPGIGSMTVQPGVAAAIQKAWHEPAGGNRRGALTSFDVGNPTAKFGVGPSNLR